MADRTVVRGASVVAEHARAEPAIGVRSGENGLHPLPGDADNPLVLRQDTEPYKSPKPVCLLFPALNARMLTAIVRLEPAIALDQELARLV